MDASRPESWVEIVARDRTFHTSWTTLTGRLEASRSMFATRRQWLQDQGKSLAILYVDEDPGIFSHIIKYLTNCGQPGAVQLLPSDRMEREELRLMAGRLELPELERLLTPPSDILGHYQEGDKGIKEREDAAIRTMAARSLGSEAAAAATLIDPFGPAEQRDLFAATPAEEITYPLLFTHMNHPTLSRPAEGTRLIVDTVDEFKRNLNIFTSGALEGLDWSNVVLAGGSALNCLMAVPPEYEGDEERKKWLGPDWSSQNERGAGGRGAEGRSVRGIERAKSGYGGSDVDLFIVGLSPEAATAKLNSLLRQICEKLELAGDTPKSLVVVRTSAAVTIWAHEPFPKFQVVLCCYSGPADVVLHFDLDCCGVVYDGMGVRVTERARRAITHRMNLVEPTKLSPTLESRLLKYAFRGFRVAVPGFAPELVDPAIYAADVKDLRGLAWLLARHKLSLESRDLNHMEGQRKRHRTEDGKIIVNTVTYVDDAPPAEPEPGQLEMPLAIDFSDTSSLLPPIPLMVPDRKEHLLSMSAQLQKEDKPQCFVFATWYMFSHPMFMDRLPDPLLDASSLYIVAIKELLGMAPLLSIPMRLTWRSGWGDTAANLAGSFHPVTASWTAQAYLESQR